MLLPLVEIRLWCSINNKLVLRLQERFCVGGLCVAKLIAILEISRPTQPTVKSHQWDASHPADRQVSPVERVPPVEKHCSKEHQAK
jgi:hypothetical protein